MPITVQDISGTVVTFWPTDRSDGVVVEDLDADTLVEFDFWVSAYQIEGDDEETPVGKARPSWLTGSLSQSVVSGETRGVVELTIDEAEIPADVTGVRIGMSVGDGQATSLASVFYTLQGLNETGGPQGFPAGERGDVYFVGKNTSLVEPDKTVKVAAIVETAAELERAKGGSGGETAFESIFNEWQRFSHGTTGSYPENADSDNVDPVPPDDIPLADLFVYDAVTDSISQATNADPAVGFVSNQVFESYTHRAKASSTDDDDDALGLVIAFKAVEDGVDERTLSVILKPNEASGEPHTPPVLRVRYNIRQDSEKLLYENNDWFTINPDGWDVAGGVFIEVERAGDVITVRASQFGENTLDPASEITFSLTDNSETEIFREALPYGYVTNSQPDSMFSDRTFSEPQGFIYDMSQMPFRVWTFIDNTWSVDEALDFFDEVGVGRLLYNTATGKCYFIGGATPEEVVRINAQYYDFGDVLAGPLATGTETIGGFLARRGGVFVEAAVEAAVAPTADLVLEVLVNGVSQASVTLLATATSAEALALGVSYVKGDRIEVRRTNGDAAEGVYYVIAGEVV